MAQANGKRANDFRRLKGTVRFLRELSDSTGIPAESLILTVESAVGTPTHEQGTWGHPQVAMKLAQWCSVPFQIKVSDWLHGKLEEKKALAQPAPAGELTPGGSQIELLVKLHEGQGRIIAVMRDHESRLVALEQVPPRRPELPAAPQKSLRAAVAQLINAYGKEREYEFPAPEMAYSEARGRLYRELKYRCGFDAPRRARRSGKRAADEIEDAGLMPQLYAIALEILG